MRSAARRIAVDAPIALWCVDLTADPAPPALAWLSAEEIARAARFRRAEHRRRYLAAHVALRLVLFEHGGICPAAQRFARDRWGKWQVGDDGRWQVSLSYAGDTALIGLAAGRAIGVDLERTRPIDAADELAALYFTPAERRAYLALPAGCRSSGFFAAWTRKEAVLKAFGVGLRLAPTTVDCGLDGERTVRCGEAAAELGSFRLDGLIAAWARLRPSIGAALEEHGHRGAGEDVEVEP